MKTRPERWAEARDRWPGLYELMASHFHQDFVLDYGSVGGAISAATASGSVEHRRAIIQELSDWSASEEFEGDIRNFLNEGLSVSVWFKKPIDARNLMDAIASGMNETIQSDLRGQGR